MIHLCLCLFGIFILTQVSFVRRSNSLSYLWQADQLLKHKAALSCIQSCSINRGLCGRAFTCTRLPQNAIWRGWGRAPSLFFMAVTNALSLPYHTNKNNFGLDWSVEHVFFFSHQLPRYYLLSSSWCLKLSDPVPFWTRRLPHDH